MEIRWKVVQFGNLFFMKKKNAAQKLKVESEQFYSGALMAFFPWYTDPNKGKVDRLGDL